MTCARLPPEMPAPETSDDLDRALEAIIAELAAARRAEAHARATWEAARARAHAVSTAASRLVQLVAPEARKPWYGRLSAATGQLEAGKQRHTRDPRLREVYAFLTWRERDVFRTADLTAWLEERDFTLPPTYAANCCRGLTDRGLLTRTGHGLYTINRTHPVMVDVELDTISNT